MDAPNGRLPFHFGADERHCSGGYAHIKLYVPSHTLLQHQMRAFTSRRTTMRPMSVRFCSITGNWKSSPLSIPLVDSSFITVPFSTGSKRRRWNLLDFHQSWNTTMSGRFKNWIPRIRCPCSNGLNGLFSVRLYFIQSTFLLQS